MATEETIDNSGKILERTIERSETPVPGVMLMHYVHKTRQEAVRCGYAGYRVTYWDHFEGRVVNEGMFKVP